MIKLHDVLSLDNREGLSPIYLRLIFAMLQFQILNFMNWIFLSAVACKIQV